MKDRRFAKLPSMFGPTFTNPVYGLFTRWTCEINPKYLGNVPSGVAGLDLFGLLIVFGKVCAASVKCRYRELKSENGP